MTTLPTGCIVLGATSGIGRQLATRLADQGVPLVLTYLTSEIAAHQIQEDIGDTASLVKADVTNPKDIENVLRVAEKHLPKVDLLVNTVGFSLSLDLMEITYETWRTTADANLYGVLLAAQVIGNYMQQNGGGSIVNVSSVAGIRPLPRGQDYVAAKAAIGGLTKSLALALAPNVIVNAIAPGWIDTERRHRSVENDGAAFSKIPLERFGNADDVVDAILFLARKQAYITGQTIVVDGGFTL